MQWFDTVQSQQPKDFVEQQARWAAECWRRMKHEEQQEEKRKEQEEIRKVADRKADRERKREMARRAKETGPEAIRKSKYPRCP